MCKEKIREKRWNKINNIKPHKAVTYHHTHLQRHFDNFHTPKAGKMQNKVYQLIKRIKSLIQI